MTLEGTDGHRFWTGRAGPDARHLPLVIGLEREKGLAQTGRRLPAPPTLCFGSRCVVSGRNTLGELGRRARYSVAGSWSPSTGEPDSDW